MFAGLQQTMESNLINKKYGLVGRWAKYKSRNRPLSANNYAYSMPPEYAASSRLVKDPVTSFLVGQGTSQTACPMSGCQGTLKVEGDDKDPSQIPVCWT